ncbi:sensor histidine kinase [Solimicrobium silvestre]|uniref:histidine kinase n=1 Tax=Solimicrobium silvestre TaxID=2099400 RepID=A0A2S9H2E4_9BURK|nr:ATP-binding protein [Solimicrobium silvestre]PRC94149.1 Histidine kinase-, DNA gyrase B-, and HSP90-like ATPase [Solimicrobium silvestre]
MAALERTQQNHVVTHPCVLADIVKQVLEELAPLAQHKNSDLGIDNLDETVLISAPVYLLHELVLNLVENAIQHMTKSGVVTISILREKNNCIFRVVDNGPGIPESERKNVLQRFYRLDASQSTSSGLGLSIANEIALSINAQLVLTTPLSGQGLQVDMRFISTIFTRPL